MTLQPILKIPKMCLFMDSGITIESCSIRMFSGPEKSDVHRFSIRKGEDSWDRVILLGGENGS